jgi:hypothetical protein
MEYATVIEPNKPIEDRLSPDSCSQADNAEPIITHGNPLAMPNKNTNNKRLSL